MSFACCKRLGLRLSLRRGLPHVNGRPLILRASILRPQPLNTAVGDGLSSLGDRFVAQTGFDPRAEAGRIEPGDAGGHREVGPTEQMETR